MKRDPNCTRCQLHEHAYTKCIPGKGIKSRSRIMLVGEAPGHDEDILGIPFVGKAGKLLDHIIDKTGIPAELFWITNLLRCRPPKNKLPPMKELRVCHDKCAPFLVYEVKTVKPEIIVLMGKTPIQMLSGVTMVKKTEGMILNPEWHRRIPLMGCYHPAAALRNPSLEKNIATCLIAAARHIGLNPKPKGLEAGFYDYEVRT